VLLWWRDIDRFAPVVVVWTSRFWTVHVLV